MKQEISSSNDYINLTKDYVYNDSEDNLEFSKSLTIEGNNHTMDNVNSTFDINTENNELELTFLNVNFKNLIFAEKNIKNPYNITLINCYYIINESESTITAECYYSYTTNSTNASSILIETVAKSIVGNSTGIDAIKKIAEWISENVKGESRAGFYQTPLETLFKLAGNCCSQTDLFFNMCYLLNLTENHTLYYVHVGNLKYRQRHFFALVDNIPVDVSLKNPWGRGGFFNRTVINISPYPILPIPREY